MSIVTGSITTGSGGYGLPLSRAFVKAFEYVQGEVDEIDLVIDGKEIIDAILTIPTSWYHDGDRDDDLFDDVKYTAQEFHFAETTDGLYIVDISTSETTYAAELMQWILSHLPDDIRTLSAGIAYEDEDGQDHGGVAVVVTRKAKRIFSTWGWILKTIEELKREEAKGV